MAEPIQTDHLLQQFEKDGFLVIRGCLDPAELEKLKDAFHALVDKVDETELTRIFTTADHQTKKNSDEYFLDSGDKVRFFIEEKAVQDGKLICPKRQSINKVGHALYELDQTFRDFTKLPFHIQLAKSLGLKNPLVAQSMYITKQPLLGGTINIQISFVLLLP